MNGNLKFFLFLAAIAIIFLFWPQIVSKVYGALGGLEAKIKDEQARRHSFWRVLQNSELLKSSLRFPISFTLLGFALLLLHCEAFPKLNYTIAIFFWAVSLVSLLHVLFARRNKTWPLMMGFLLALFSLLFAFYGLSLSVPDRSQQEGAKLITYLDDFVSTTYQALRVLTLNAEPEFRGAPLLSEQVGVETESADADSSGESSGYETAPTTASEKSASLSALQSAGVPSSEQQNGSSNDQLEPNPETMPETGENQVIESNQAKNIGPTTEQQQEAASDLNPATPLPPQSPNTPNNQFSEGTDSGGVSSTNTNQPTQPLGSDNPPASGNKRQVADKETVSRYAMILARLLALLFTLWAAYKIISILAQRSLDLMRIYWLTCKIGKPPVLIVGLGHVGLQLVRELRQDIHPRNVIVLEKNEKEPNIEHARRLGAIVLERDAFLPETLNELPYCAIREIYVVGGTDDANIDISINLMKAAKEQSEWKDIPWRKWSRRLVMVLLMIGAVGSAVLAITTGNWEWIFSTVALLAVAGYLPILARFEDTVCYVQIFQPNLQRVLHQAFEAEFGEEEAHQEFRLKFFNSDLNAVTQLIVNKLTTLRPTQPHEVALYIIVGFDAMWEEIAVGLTQLAHFENLKRSRMLILLDNPRSQSASFCARYPRFTVDNSVKDTFVDIHYDPLVDDWNYTFAGSPAGRTDVNYDDARQVDQELSLVKTGCVQPPTTPAADSGNKVETAQSKDEPQQPSGGNQLQSEGSQQNPGASPWPGNLRQEPFVRGLVTGLKVNLATDAQDDQQPKVNTSGQQPQSHGGSPPALDELKGDANVKQPQKTVVVPSGVRHRAAPAKYVGRSIEIEGPGNRVADFLNQLNDDDIEFRAAKTFGYEFATHTLFAPMPAHPADDSFLKMLHRIIQEQDIPGADNTNEKRIIKPVILVAGRDEAKSYVWSRDFINQWYRYRAQNSIKPPAIGDQSSPTAVSPPLFVWLPSERRLREVVEENKQAVRTALEIPQDSGKSLDILTGYFDHFGDPEESCEIDHIQAKQKEALSNATQISYDEATKGDGAIWNLMAFYGRGPAGNAPHFADITNTVTQAIYAHIKSLQPSHDQNKQESTRHMLTDGNTDKSSKVLPMEVIGELRSKADRFISRVSKIADAMTVRDSIFFGSQDGLEVKQCVEYFGRQLNNDQNDFKNALGALENHSEVGTDSGKTGEHQAVTSYESCFDFIESRIIQSHEWLAAWLGWWRPERESGINTRSLKKRGRPLRISKKTFKELSKDISTACAAIVDQYSRLTCYVPCSEPAATTSENSQFRGDAEDSTGIDHTPMAEKEATYPDSQKKRLQQAPNTYRQPRKYKKRKKAVDKIRQKQAVIEEAMQEILARCLRSAVAAAPVAISIQKFDNNASNEFAAVHALIKYQIAEQQPCKLKDTFDAAEFEESVLKKLIRSAIEEALSVLSGQRSGSTSASQDTSTGSPKVEQRESDSLSHAEHLRWCAEMLMRNVQFVVSEGKKIKGADGKNYRTPEQMYLRETLCPKEKLNSADLLKDRRQVEFVIALLDSMKEK